MEFLTSELHLSPPPDEAIATGCALQASLMQKQWERREDSEMEEEEEDVTLSCVPCDLWIKVLYNTYVHYTLEAPPLLVSREMTFQTSCF